MSLYNPGQFHVYTLSKEFFKDQNLLSFIRSIQALLQGLFKEYFNHWQGQRMTSISIGWSQLKRWTWIDWDWMIEWTNIDTSSKTWQPPSKENEGNAVTKLRLARSHQMGWHTGWDWSGARPTHESSRKRCDWTRLSSWSGHELLSWSGHDVTTILIHWSNV